jgi:Tfp pilus assembly protein PilE
MLSTKIQLLMMQGKLKRSTAQGFTMVEVVVAILLTLIFTAISMQAIVMGTAVKVHGDEIASATSWIQEDLEGITNTANTGIEYDSSTTKYSTNPASTQCASPTSTTGYASILLAKTSVNGDVISSTAAITKTSATGNRSYSLVRTATVKPDPNPPTPPAVSDWRFNVVQIDYQVYRGTGTSSPILQTPFHAEVIPGASFYCRQFYKS